jgi:hypothetical protein
MRHTISSVAILALAVAAGGVAGGAACGGRTVAVTPRQAVTPAMHAELRVDPGATSRDLFWGVGGRRYAPPADAPFTLVGKDETGFSVSYDVTSADGIEWSAKVGPEAQTEVVLSRVLWGLGYHQPPVYYLPSWKIDTGEGETITVSEARFRPKLPRLDRGEFWSWADNPFSGTGELKGLLVILLMLNSSDLKDDNNSIYDMTEPWDGASRWYVVRDLGAALGETGKLYPRRNWFEGFEREPFITAVNGSAVTFGYKGRHQELFSMIGLDDVTWAAGQLGRLTDAQWGDAFRAANYAPAPAGRFLARIKEKIADGLALRVDRRAVND